MKTPIEPHRIRARNRQGRCYELAARGQLNDHSWLLVHGHVRDGLPHAWLVRGDEAYDPVLDRIFPRAEWGVESLTYTAKEAARLIVDEGHYGPWHIGLERRKTRFNREVRTTKTA